MTPLLKTPGFDAAGWLCANMAELFIKHSHSVMISTSLENNIPNILTCPAPEAKKQRFYRIEDNKSYEEYLYSNGFLTEEYLENDFQILVSVIQEYRPDLVITMDRIAAVIAAKAFSIPCWAIVNGEMSKGTSFPSRCLRPLNALLKTRHFPLVFSLKDLYAMCDRRITFGHALTQPIEAKDLYRFGSQKEGIKRTRRNNRICIFVSELKMKQIRILKHEFLDTPYSVYFSHPGCNPHTEKNIKWIRYPKPGLLAGCTCIVHDGNDYLFNQAMTLGIPQLIITDHGYLRSYLASAAKRNHFGTFVYEEELNADSIHDAFRNLIDDDTYYHEARFIKKQISKLGDLSEIMNLLR